MSIPEPASRPKKIIGLFTDLLGVGGVQEAGRATAAALDIVARSHGCPIEILSLNDSRGEYSLPYCGSAISVVGVGRSKAGFVLTALQKALLAPRKGTSVIVAGHPHLALPASYIQSICPRFRIIVMSHGVEVWTPLTRAKLRALRKAKFVVAPSNYTADKLSDVQLIPKSRIRRLPWPLSPDFLRLASAPSNLPRPLNFPHGQIILTVGRWASAERYKGTDELILATARLLESLPNLHLVAVGSGDDLPRLRNIAAENKVMDHVHFLENLSQAELAACYANAHVFALPSTGEGFGLVFLEAMAFGKPVVGADAGGATDLIRDGINGLLIPPNNIERLAQGLKRLVQDENLRGKLGACGAKTVRREYQFEAFRGNLEAILCDAAAGPS